MKVFHHNHDSFFFVKIKLYSSKDWNMYDKYISVFNDNDRAVRKLDNYTSKSSLVTLDTNQRDILENDRRNFEAKLKQYPRFKDIIWIEILFFKDTLLENGYPHTTGNKIMLPIEKYFSMEKREDRVKLLIHEYLHIYQRAYPFEFNFFLINILGLEVHDYVPSSKYQTMKRSNPDINNIIYKMENNKYNVMIFDSNPKTLKDAHIHKDFDNSGGIVLNNTTHYSELIKHYQGRVHIQEEHPYEALATILSYVILTGDTSFKILKDYLQML